MIKVRSLTQNFKYHIPIIGPLEKYDEGLTVSALQITALVQIIIVFVIPLVFNIVIVVLIIIELNKKVSRARVDPFKLIII